MSQSRNKVRIIGGEFRRRMLPFPDAAGLRPTPDRVRETLFNWLGQDLYGKSCLDLFAGSGALGFEAASRNARRVVMVEKSRLVCESLQANRQLLKAEALEVVGGDALLYLKNARERFDVVFVDPPYDSELLQQVLPRLAELLSDDGVAYVEARQWPDALPAGLTLLRRDKAGMVHYGLLGRATQGA
ncbi:16S rRNA (guanine(966)-N(2))-methyltransferase RsmD [Chromobacterium paludis]|uniref:16S rRNA (Guanine(966)-N(2))-methyltransferase RsmD n=1 Tax=Chromobacterium paludis TaxID=2605945 RepID=A0A5C1DLL5_9NEIS|nr:16S rRNA (guanine(966)-N(2))-methyltransferase RsmD [Chromobacterium paludis]QEL57554.1 16S rRNA (guanine(966)-N(2))-methyltransferase RsmD [Chromobacterium paludis]